VMVEPRGHDGRSCGLHGRQRVHRRGGLTHRIERMIGR
jgi:hypothetical protein